MNRSSVVVVLAGSLAACGSSTPAPTVISQPAPVAVRLDAGGPAPPQMIDHEGPLRAKIEAPHGAAIAIVAEAGDGTAALTQDELGGMRLWPALDGSREPCVVDLPAARGLALGRHGGALFVAMIDAAGSLTLASLDDQGRTLRHMSLPQDADYLGVAMTELGVLAWRNDQTVVLYGFDGSRLGRLGTEPGERIDSVATNGRHALVVVVRAAGTAPTRALRGLVLEPRLAWDKPLDVGGDPLGPIAISRTGTRVAVALVTSDKASHEVHVLELATGHVLASQKIGGPPELGFADEDHVAAGMLVKTSWITTKPNSPAFVAGSPMAGALFAVGEGVTVTAAGSELRLDTMDDTKYLGYELESPQFATLGPHGDLIVGVRAQVAELDASLAAVSATPPVFPAKSTITELRWLGGADYAANVMSEDGTVQVMIASSDGHDPIALRPPGASRSVQPLRYEPSTHLLTLSFNDASVERWVPEQRKIEHLALLPHRSAQDRELVPLAPALAGGNELVDVTLDAAGTVAWTDATTQKRSAAMPISAFINADAAGHVFAWTVDPSTRQLGIVVLAPGKVLAALPHDGPVTLWPDPTGTRVLEVGSSVVALYQLDGTLVWKQHVVGATEALWTSDRAIAIITASGIAMLDAASGAPTAARCGWRFALAAMPHPGGTHVEPICTQLRP